MFGGGPDPSIEKNIDPSTGYGHLDQLEEGPLTDHLKQFEETGFFVAEGALATAEINKLNAGIEADTAANPKAWEPGPRPGFVTVGCGAPELMHRTDALDGIVHHPTLDPIVKAILGQDAAFSALSFTRREPCDAIPPADTDGGDPLVLSRNWHREYSGIVEGADRNAYYAPAIQIIYYLDDVDEQSHCTSIIPESAETKRALTKTRAGRGSWGARTLRIEDDAETRFVDPEKPTWLDAFGREFPRRVGGIDVTGSAGTALVFNITNYHCATVRRTERHRRSIHVFYRTPDPTHSRHALTGDFESVEAFQSSLPDRETLRL